MITTVVPPLDLGRLEAAEGHRREGFSGYVGMITNAMFGAQSSLPIATCILDFRLYLIHGRHSV